VSAVETLREARAAGLSVGVEGTDLVLDAEDAPPDELVDALWRDKAEILNLLNESTTGEKDSATGASKLPDLQGLTIEDMQDAAGEDWPMVQAEPTVLESLAHAVVNRRLRERGERQSYII
jgi:hypothetical protein